jgi:hypothetical protein
MSLDLELFKERHRVFEKLDFQNYPNTFDDFWVWKNKIETNSAHILDKDNKKRTYSRLSKILKIWQAYRPVDSEECLPRFRTALEEISDAYMAIKDFSLLDFSQIPDKPLEKIWHELGCTKENEGEKIESGRYLTVPICKPLMFLWGQTLAFDSRVKEHMPTFGKYNYTIKATRWTFKTWKEVMLSFTEMLEKQREAVVLFKQISSDKYGGDAKVPYGQFLDLYYWVWNDKLDKI